MSMIRRRDFLKSTAALAAATATPAWRAPNAPPLTSSPWASPASKSPASPSAPAPSEAASNANSARTALPNSSATPTTRASASSKPPTPTKACPKYYGIALKGLPRDSYRIMTKYRLRTTDDPQATIDRFRRELNTEYFDILLLHCVRTTGWATQFESLRDALSRSQTQESHHGPRSLLPRPPPPPRLPRQ